MTSPTSPYSDPGVAVRSAPPVIDDDPVPPPAAAQAVPPAPRLNPLVIVEAVTRTLQGLRPAAELAVMALLAEGHLLVEDVPGVGKTTLAKALAGAISASVGRIQFTPDLLPSDIVGVNIFRADARDFEFIPGPVFNHIVIADEINRASPKTQSALLEAMQEDQVTVEGRTHTLPRPFVVLATQNPIEMDGTYPLPEAQRDRFMMRLSLGYPDAAHEVTMLEEQEFVDPLTDVHPVATLEQVRTLVDSVRRLYAAPAIKRYIVALASATRDDPELVLGASPRASNLLLRASKAAAALAGRAFVLPDDVQRVIGPTWGHRLILRRTATGGADGLDYVNRLVARVRVG
ncbi:MAG: AAA family ATPase [Actinomycetia bacterium]|nr:AAA family ATPase [Actinomycetes bacterium]